MALTTTIDMWLKVTSLLAALLAGAALEPGSPSAGTRVASSGAPQVTLVGDSVADGLRADPAALRTLGQNVELHLQVAPCRGLVTSCPDGDAVPATMLDVARNLGPAPGTVVVVGGYNESRGAFADDLRTVLHAFEAGGVAHVLWATLHDPTSGGDLTQIDGALRAEAAADPVLSLVEWDGAAQGHPGWFQPDGIHLAGDGPQALASLIHAALVRQGIAAPAPPAPPPPARRPVGVAPKPFHRALV
jgi:hypothetical protein